MTARHRTKSLIAAGAAFALANLATIDAVHAAPVRRDFSLAPQPLAQQLRSVGHATGREIMFPADAVAGLTGRALQGSYTADEAVDLLLGGTGLVADHQKDVILIGGRAETGSGVSGEADRAPEIVVTGSRLRGAPVASPMITLTQQSIRDAGLNTMADVLRDIPQNSGGGQNPGIGNNVPTSSGVNIGSGSTIDLRGLGSDATLTLLNGHRLAYNITRQGIDVSSIPIAALDRIEIVADGASALYGSDAVAGVANIILKRDFSGVTTTARLGAATDGGDAQQEYSIVAGKTWNGGGAMLAYDFERDTAISARERSYAATLSPGLTLLPAIKHHNVIATGHQALGGDLEFDIDAFYNSRQTSNAYSVAEGVDDRIVNSARVRSFAIAPSLTLTLPNDWRVQLPAMVGGDRTHYASDEFVGGSDVFPVRGCYCNTAKSIEVGADGPLFRLPGGAVSVAVGAGYRTNSFHGTQLVFGEPSSDVQTRQDVTYGYGEIDLPLVSPSLDVPLVRSLNLSGALRWEDYRGIDKVLTPKFGLVYAPVSGLTLKASWGRSFKAPTLYQLYSQQFAFLENATSLGATGTPAGSTALLVQGGNPTLKPERARNWSASLVAKPIEGLTIETGYFDIRYKDRVVSPVTFLLEALTNPIYADLVDDEPSPAEISTALAGKTFFNNTASPYDPSSVVAIVNDPYLNVASQTVRGVDLAIAYRQKTERLGSFGLTADASYLSSRQRLSALQPSTKLAGTLFNPPHFHTRVGGVWSDQGLTLSTYVNYLGGLEDVRFDPARHVGSLTTVDATARFSTPSSRRIVSGIDFTLSVQNLLNAKPARIFTTDIYEAPFDTTNYSPIGRFVSITLSKHW
jgi:outer membrane receptor protein involved in Fe transport